MNTSTGSPVKPELPQLPGSALRVIKLSQDLDAPPRALVNAIGSDPVLTGRVIQAVNSPVYALRRSVSDLSQAVNILGVKAISQIVMAYAASDVFRGSGLSSFAERALWRHSVAVGTAAREIYLEVRRKQDSETAFLGGLMHDIGKLTILRQRPGLEGPFSSFTVDTELFALESKELGYTHSHVGLWIAKQWSLSDEIAEAIALHHTPHVSKRALVLACAINVADQLANAAGFGLRRHKDGDVAKSPAATTLGMTRERLAGVWEKTETSIEETMSLLSSLL